MLSKKVTGVTNLNSEHVDLLDYHLANITNFSLHDYFPSICFMVLEHCTLVPLIINYRMGRDLMKIFTFKWPRIMSVRKHIFFIANRCSSDHSQTTAHSTRIHTYVTHIAHAHEHISCIITNSAFTLSHKKQLMNSPEVATLCCAAVWHTHVAKSKCHDSKMGHNNE